MNYVGIFLQLMIPLSTYLLTLEWNKDYTWQNFLPTNGSIVQNCIMDSFVERFVKGNFVFVLL